MSLPSRPVRHVSRVRIAGILAAASAALVSSGVAASATTPTAPAAVTDADALVVEETGSGTVAEGVQHTSYRVTTPAGASNANLLTVDLTVAETDLLTAPSVTGIQRMDTMGYAAGAVAAVNGDFFNNTTDAAYAGITPTQSASGVEIKDGEIRKSAVPKAQRHGESLPEDDGNEVIGVLSNHRGVVTDVDLRAHLDSAATGKVTIDGLNQYGMARNQITAFDENWGDVWGPQTRERVACGSEVSRRDPCTTDVVEVVLTDGVVTSVSDTIGGRLAENQVALVGREDGADELRRLAVGDAVETNWNQVSDAGHLDWAVGGGLIVRDGELAPIPDRALNPRTTAGVSEDGSTLYLLVVDGRHSDSVGISTRDNAQLILELGADDAVLLDGGGSSTMLTRPDTTSDFTLLSRSREAGIEVLRYVPNGIGVFESTRS